MKLANIAKVSVFILPLDNEGQVLDKLKSFFPFDLSIEHIPINSKKALGFNEQPIKIIEVVLEKDRHINQFLGHLAGIISDEQKQLINRQLDLRIDNDLNFFLRFDKAKLILENKHWITDNGNCYHIKISIAAFPHKKEVAKQIMEKVFKLAK